MSLFAQMMTAMQILYTNTTSFSVRVWASVTVCVINCASYSKQVRAQGSTEGPSLTQPSRLKRIFGISSSSRIGWIIHSFLTLIPGIANNQDQMAETTELYDNWLKFELLDHYDRMTTRKRMSSASMQQWLTGAAIHLHMRIHQVRTDR